MIINHLIEQAPGADGPYYVVTRNAETNVVSNVTLGLANVNAALDQCKTDAAGLLGGATVNKITIVTSAS